MKKLEIEMIRAKMDMSGPEPDVPFYGKRTISASMIGDSCDAALEYNLRGFPGVQAPDRRRRIFELGDKIEDLVIEHMRGQGFPVIGKDPATGRQHKLLAYYGHVKAYIDGIILWDEGDEPLEIKSMNTARFKALMKDDIKTAEPKYYDQCQLIICLFESNSLLFVAYNKDDSSYWPIRVERDDDRILFLKAKIERVLNSESRRVAKLAKEPGEKKPFGCIMCGLHQYCREGKKIEILDASCHHCAYATPDEDQRWWCEKKEIPATTLCRDFKQYEPKD